MHPFPDCSSSCADCAPRIINVTNSTLCKTTNGFSANACPIVHASVGRCGGYPVLHSNPGTGRLRIGTVSIEGCPDTESFIVAGGFKPEGRLAWFHDPTNCHKHTSNLASPTCPAMCAIMPPFPDSASRHILSCSCQQQHHCCQQACCWTTHLKPGCVEVAQVFRLGCHQGDLHRWPIRGPWRCLAVW